VALPPLSHHEIIGLVEPFTRTARRVDLEASNRLERRLCFKPLEHPASDAGPALTEQLELHQPYRGLWRLTRTLSPATGLSATLIAEGPEPAPLLPLIDAVPHHAQFRRGRGFTAALEQLASPEPLLVKASALVAGLSVTFTMPRVSGLPAELVLLDETGDCIALPDDLVAVLGWDWAPLKRDGQRWATKIRLRGSGARKSHRALEKFEATVHHLVRVFDEPPAQFHHRFVAARWWASVRRTIPVLTSALVMVAAGSVPTWFVEKYPVTRQLLMTVPLAIIALSFTLQELSRVEIAPVPRASRAPSWRSSAVTHDQ
jgi:hypothetical protein